jgi:predicted nucleic acid-binding protein
VPDRFALDTNVYIQALRNPAGVAALKRFLLRFGTRTRLHSIVALELRAGARRPDQARALEPLIASYVARERTIVPSFDAFVQSGRALAALANSEGYQSDSLVADALLAASCRESRTVLVTANVRHFVALQRHLRGFRFLDWQSALQGL